jgi:hypothetical protein
MTYFVTEGSVATEIEDEPIKWIFSFMMASAKLLILQELSSHYKMAPDIRLPKCMRQIHAQIGIPPKSRQRQNCSRRAINGRCGSCGTQ